MDCECPECRAIAIEKRAQNRWLCFIIMELSSLIIVIHWALQAW